MEILWQLLLAIAQSMKYSMPSVRHAELFEDVMGQVNFLFLPSKRINWRVTTTFPALNIQNLLFSHKIPVELILKNEARLAAWYNTLRAYLALIGYGL